MSAATTTGERAPLRAGGTARSRGAATGARNESGAGR